MFDRERIIELCPDKVGVGKGLRYQRRQLGGVGHIARRRCRQGHRVERDRKERRSNGCGRVARSRARTAGRNFLVGGVGAKRDLLTPSIGVGAAGASCNPKKRIYLG